MTATLRVVIAGAIVAFTCSGCAASSVSSSSTPKKTTWLGMTPAESQHLHRLYHDLRAILVHKHAPLAGRIAQMRKLERAFRSWVAHPPRADQKPVTLAKRCASVAQDFIAFSRAPSRAAGLTRFLVAAHRANTALHVLQRAAASGPFFNP